MRMAEDQGGTLLPPASRPLSAIETHSVALFTRLLQPSQLAAERVLGRIAASAGRVRREGWTCGKRLSPVCVRRWRCSSSDRVKRLPQKSQLQTKGRSPVCQRR